VKEFSAAVMAELSIRSPDVGRDSLRSLYLGGGTPSKLGGDGIQDLLSGFAQWLGVDDFSTYGRAFELTIEANPEDVNATSAAAWAAAGVGRVSLGVQSFDAEVLRWMHREHSVDQVSAAVRTLRGEGIPDIAVDLIFAVPGHLERDWIRDLDLALELESTQLSIYGLTVEPKTPLGRWTARGEVTEAPEERYEAEFLEADRRLRAAGYEHYEVSNYGRPGHRAVHNSAYWTGVPYLGLGPAAHGFDGGVRRWNLRQYAEWQAKLAAGGDPEGGAERIGPEERVAEEVYLGLRTSDGLSVRQSELNTVTSWIEAGWGELRESAAEPAAEPAAGSTDRRLRLTPTGWLRLDSLAAALTSLRSRS
jgi:oxygen-independent coproporphyrinogen-3 oxidase